MPLPSTPNPSSCSRRKQDKQVVEKIDFPGGLLRAGKLFEWFEQSTSCREIIRLQLRKDISGVHHRFIVLYMKDAVVHRFDRRPDPDRADRVRTVKGEPVPARDEHTRNVNEASLRNIEEATLCEIELSFPDGVDILSVIAACYSIAQDPAARDYSLFTHNCFFFSWTILMVVSRQYLPHRVPSPDVLVQRCLSTIQKVISETVDLCLANITGSSTSLLSAFLETTWPFIRSDMDFLLRLGLSIPPVLLKPMCKAGCQIYTRLSLRGHVKTLAETFVQQKIPEIWQNILARKNLEGPLNAQLWLSDTQLDLVQILDKELLESLLENMGVIFANACTRETEELVKKLASRKRLFMLTRRLWLISSVLADVVYGVLLAMNEDLKNRPYDGGETQESMFDRVWSCSREASLSAFRTAVGKFRSKLKEKDRDEWDRKWERVLKFHGTFWDAAQKPMRELLLNLIKLTTAKHAEFGARLLRAEVREDKSQSLEARVLKSAPHSQGSKDSDARMTNANLQDYVLKMMREDTPTTQNTIRTSMARVWKATQAELRQDPPTTDAAQSPL